MMLSVPGLTNGSGMLLEYSYTLIARFRSTITMITNVCPDGVLPGIRTPVYFGMLGITRAKSLASVEV